MGYRQALDKKVGKEVIANAAPRTMTRLKEREALSPDASGVGNNKLESANSIQ